MSCRDGALDDAEELTGILGDDLVAVGLGLNAGRHHHGLVVVEGNSVEEDLFHGGLGAPQERFAAARTLGEVKPEDRRPVGAGECVGDPGGVRGSKAKGGGHRAAVLEKTSSRNAFVEVGPWCDGLVHTVDSCVRVTFSARLRSLTAAYAIFML